MSVIINMDADEAIRQQELMLKQKMGTKKPKQGLLPQRQKHNFDSADFYKNQEELNKKSAGNEYKEEKN